MKTLSKSVHPFVTCAVMAIAAPFAAQAQEACAPYTVRDGDSLVVTRVDRLARSVGDLQDIVRLLKQKGVTLKATEQPIDTSSAAGKAFLDMLGVFAEFETNLRRERQMEGIAAAKSRGVYKGRKPHVDVAEIRRLKSDGMGPTEIAKTLNIGRASVYRALREAPSS